MDRRPWFKSPNGGVTWNMVSGSTKAATLNTQSIPGTRQYQVKFSNPLCPDVLSNVVTVTVKPPYAASIVFAAADCKGILCPNSVMNLLPNPITPPTAWDWYLDNGSGTPLLLGGTTGLYSYVATSPGTYSVIVKDPYCGDVTTNSLKVKSFEASLGGDECICFGKPYDLKITTNYCRDVLYTVVMYKTDAGTTNPVQIYSGPPIMSVSEVIPIPSSIINQVIFNKDDQFSGTITGPCGTIQLNYIPTGCKCPP